LLILIDPYPSGFLFVHLFGYFIFCLLLIAPVAAHSEPTSRIGEVPEDMVLIPAGTYKRGCDRFGPQHGSPAHLVYLDAFMIDKYELTNEKFEMVFPEHFLRRSQFSHCNNCPVSKISWYEAADYCHLKGKSLPSEAQWERAAQGQNGCEFPWGPDFNPEQPQARGGLKLKDKGTPVGSFAPNKNGIYDMAGNVWEWVSDWFSIRYYFREIMYNPRGPIDGKMKVRRGGSWSDSIMAMKTGYRDWSYPFSRGFNDIGFRCAINLKMDSK
jgi:formylglycine-generating enzyme